MATTKKSTKGKQVKVNKLKVQKEKVLTNKDSKRIRGGRGESDPKKPIISV